MLFRVCFKRNDRINEHKEIESTWLGCSLFFHQKGKEFRLSADKRKRFFVSFILQEILYR